MRPKKKTGACGARRFRHRCEQSAPAGCEAPAACSGSWRKSLHQQHLSRALDGRVEPALIVRGQAGVLARKDAPLVGDELPEQIGVLVVDGIDGEIDLRLGTDDAWLGRARALVVLLGMSLAGH